VGFGTVPRMPRLADGFGLFSSATIEPWFWGRFRGWSTRPNQLAPLRGALFFLALFLADAATGTAARVAALRYMIPPAILGRLSQSDTFTPALFGVGPIWFCCKLLVWPRSPEPGATSRSSFALLMLAVLPALMLSMSPVLILHRLMQGSSRWKLPRAAAPRRPMRRTCAFLYNARPSCTVLNQPCWALALGRTMEIPMKVVAGRGTSDQPGNIDHPMQRCHSLSEPPSGLSAHVC
jgi:hypothetical protein